MKNNLHPIFPCVISLFVLLGSPSLLVAQQWDTLSPIPASFTFPVVVAVDGKIHIMGGGGTSGATNLHYAYDPATDTWESKANLPYVAQQPAGAAANGKIHFFGGGFPNSGSPVNDHYMYDVATDTWAQAADLTAPRAIHYGVGLDGVVYSLAGQGMANLCQAYDADNDVWVTKNNLPDNGFWYGAHVATNGHIYRFCGGGYTAPNSLAHRYNPVTDTWSVLPSFPSATHGISGAAIGNKIYLAGGYNNFTERDEVFIFDTQTETYEAGIPLPIGRDYHNMVSIDSCIYVVGGNHAIDLSVKFQLLRFCPEETSSIREQLATERLDASYFSEKIVLQIPPTAMGKLAELSLIDLSGRLVFFEKIDNLSSVQEGRVGRLPVGIYAMQLRTGNAVYTGKVLVQ